MFTIRFNRYRDSKIEFVAKTQILSNAFGCSFSAQDLLLLVLKIVFTFKNGKSPGQLELKETKSAKLFKRKVFKNYLDSYASYICKKNNCFSCE